MGLYMASNGSAMTVLRHLTSSSKSLSLSMERLTTGYRINRASDGAAQLAISEKLAAQVRGAQAAQSNVTSGISMLNVADQSVQGMYAHLHNIRDLAVQAASATTDNYTSISNQLAQEVAAINQLATGTTFNGKVLLNGSLPTAGTFNIQAGPNSTDAINITSAFSDAQATTLGIALTAVTSAGDGSTLIGQVDTALSNLGAISARIGGMTNRLENASANLNILAENMSAAVTSIRGTDVAWESANLARFQILQQAGASMLAQANAIQSSTILRLLGG